MIISSIKPMAGMLLMLWMVTTVGCSLFPSAPSGVRDKEISYELKYNSSSDVIMIKCPGYNFKYDALPGKFVYDNDLHNKIGFKESDDKMYAWMAWKREDTSVPNLNVQCGSYFMETQTNNFKGIFWNINLSSTSTTDFLESVDLLSISDIVGNPMEDSDKCGKTNDKLKIISKDRNGALSIVERIQFNVLQSKKIFYFFDESKIEKKTEFLTPCGIADVHHSAPTILIDGNALVEIAETDGIKEKTLVKEGENKLSLKLVGQGSQDLSNFYQGEKVLIKKMLYRNGKAEVKEENGIEAFEDFIVSGYEILEISYKSLSENRNYEDVKEVVFFGPDNKDLELEDNLFNISKTDLPYQLSCPYAKYDYAYLHQVKLDKEVVNVEILSSDGAVIGDFKRSGDLVAYKPVNVDKMEWVCIYKTPNGKVTAKNQLVRTDGNKEEDKGTLSNQGDKNGTSGSTCNVSLYWSWTIFIVFSNWIFTLLIWL